MPEFLTLVPPPAALEMLLRHLSASKPAAELIHSVNALGRVTAGDICAPHPLPMFSRSAVDGYAIHAGDTFGASESLPTYLQVVGEIPMGAEPSFALEPEKAAIIHTGGMLPKGADSVVMLENTQTVSVDHRDCRACGASEIVNEASARTMVNIEVFKAVAEGENVIREGEDVSVGQVVIPAGTRLRPAEIGGLMALGITELPVTVRPKVGILSSGDEVVPPDHEPHPGQVRDVNSYSLSALVTQTGGEPVRYGIIPDQAGALKASAARALLETDLVMITAGSSASVRDLTAEVIRLLGAPGLLVHGVNVRPGKPTILAVCDGKAVIGLPGNPVSALVVAGMFVVPVIERLLGLKATRPRPLVIARLTINVPSQAGREDWIAVKLIPYDDSLGKALTKVRGDVERSKGQVAYAAEPVFAKSNLIFSLAAADGLVRVPTEATGLSSGEVVEVFLL